MSGNAKVSEVAERLSVCAETVRRMARQGVFPRAFKIGPAHCAQVRIPWADVEAYERNQPRVSR